LNSNINIVTTATLPTINAATLEVELKFTLSEPISAHVAGDDTLEL
jgi:hypothetical protein